MEKLSKQSMTVEEIENLKYGICPGLKSVYTRFFEYVQDTVNAMMKRVVKNCTRCVNECLEEGDFSNVQVILARASLELQKCRFYTHISFLEQSDVLALDRETRAEIIRYWQTMKNFFVNLSDENENTDLFDMVYFINRLLIEEKMNYGEL